MTKRFVPDERVMAVQHQHPLPLDRPATRSEIWTHYHAIYFDLKGHKLTKLCTAECDNRSPGELEVFCRDAWVWAYIDRFLRQQWAKHPDWHEGEPVIVEATIPVGTVLGGWGDCIRLVRDLHLTALNLLPERREKQLGLEAA